MKIDALLVSQPENRRYLSGYSAGDHGISESSGVLYIPAGGECLLLTDFRYQLQAENETDLLVHVYKKGLAAALTDILSSSGVKTFGFESQYTLHSLWTKLTLIAEKQNIQLQPVSDLIEKMRVIKSEDEIALLRESVQRNEQVFKRVHATISTEMSEIDIALELEISMRRAGAESPSFDTIVASAENSAMPHAAPTTEKIKTGQSITIDMGLVLSGYCSDMTRNFVVGEPDRKYLKIHRLVRKAQIAGMKAVRAGATAADVDRAARKIISDGGYGKNFGHSLGHGVGLAVHEEPRVSSKSRRKLKAGMIITIEPGIYIPGWGGVRLENMGVVREDGFENLNSDTTWLDI